jgi:hypothetical protein
MSVPLYLQALTTFEVLHRLIGHMTMYFCQRRPAELGSFAWIVDGKDVLSSGESPLKNTMGRARAFETAPCVDKSGRTAS